MLDLPYVDPGTYLFRFMDHRTDHFWSAIPDILCEQKLYLNSRTHFNDPYDSRPEIEDDVRISALRAYADEMIQNPWRRERDSEEIFRILQLRAQGISGIGSKTQASGEPVGSRRYCS